MASKNYETLIIRVSSNTNNSEEEESVTLLITRSGIR